MRLVPLSVHALVELVAGLTLVVASLLLDLGTAGLLGVFGAGVVLAGIGLGAAESLPVSAHQGLDRLLATVLAVASIGLALAGDGVAAVVLLSVAASQLVLVSLTRWVRPAARLGA